MHAYPKKEYNIMKVAIIKYNAGNIFSVQHSLQRLGIEALITADKEVISGADKIIFPEKESGIRIANNLASGNFFDAIELSTKYSMMDLDVPADWVGKTLRELNLRATKKINIIGIKRNDEFEITPDPDAPLQADDVLVIIGRNQTLSKLAGGPQG